MGRLDGKRALVSGTGGGIGRATALLLAREGARNWVDTAAGLAAGVEGGPHGIRVNAVSPAMTETPQTAPMLRAPDGPAASIAARVPLGRWGQPEDVAHAILFLCSDESAHVSGAKIPVDGGAAVVG